MQTFANPNILYHYYEMKGGAECAKQDLPPEISKKSLMEFRKISSYESLTLFHNIRFWPDKKTFIVSSKRTIAAVFSTAEDKLKISSVQLSNIHIAGLFSISSLDEQTIYKSNRLLLTFLTDAQNTGMKFSSDKKVLEQHGTLPVKILHGSISVGINHDKPLKLFALNLRGERIKELPIQHKNNKLSFDLDNKIKQWGPVVFFELVSEKAY